LNQSITLTSTLALRHALGFVRIIVEVETDGWCDWTGRNGGGGESDLVRPHAANVNSHQLTCAPEPLESQYEWSITKRNRIINLAVHARVVLPRCFSELAVFDARLYIRVRRIDEHA
jgi:hypothetical protein